MLSELGARTFAETFLEHNDPADIAMFLAATYSPAKQAVELLDAANIVLVADVDGVAAGFAMLRAGATPSCVEGDAPIELARLYVAREQLGRGVGEALMSRCLEEARRAGHATLWLGVWERNERAQRFYRRWKLRAVGEHVFQVGSDPQTDIVMCRALQTDDP
jgi:ribosomal protein S18 acetylase RimI-like enzyme